jgi:NADPH2:quinone reductase
MAEAIVIREYGDAAVMRFEDIHVDAPAAGELRVRQTCIGVNYHDVYVRSGLYKTLALPGTPGCEAAGVVEEVGEGVSDFAVGDRVAYVTANYGAYASERLLPAKLAIKLDEAISDSLAASTLLRAMTVEMLMCRVHRVQSGMTVLVHAAAGGMGKLLCQWASHQGATVIGTVGSAEKAEAAQQSGCKHPILYREVNFAEKVRELTDGKGVNVVYDSVGADTFADSLDSLALCGHLVNFGQSSGPVDPLLMSTLASKSLSVSRPILFHYLIDSEQYHTMANTVLDALRKGVLKGGVVMPFALEDAGKAHSVLEGRSGGGALVLTS